MTPGDIVRPPFPHVEDIIVADHAAAGLPVPSRIRTGKIATLATVMATLVCRLSDETWAQVRARVTRTMGQPQP